MISGTVFRGSSPVSIGVVVFASTYNTGTNAFLDDVPLERCRAFEEELFRFADNSRPQVLQQIREKKAIDDALRAEMQSLVKEFKERFTTEQTG